MSFSTRVNGDQAKYELIVAVRKNGRGRIGSFVRVHSYMGHSCCLFCHRVHLGSGRARSSLPWKGTLAFSLVLLLLCLFILEDLISVEGSVL